MDAAGETIVVGVDGSAHATEALEWAVAEARLRGAPLRAVHATDGPGGVLDEALGRVAAADVELEAVTVPGRPADALLGAASRAALLVVGSRGRGGLAGTLLGSVSRQCLRGASGPVAVVHAAHHGDRRRIVVGVDGSAGSERALAWAADEARRRGTSLLAVCAYHESMTASGGGLTAAAAVAELHLSLQRAAEQVLDRVQAAAGDDLGVATEAVHGPAADAILSRAADAEMLVVGSRGRGGVAGLVLGSVSLHCATHARGVAVVVP